MSRRGGSPRWPGSPIVIRSFPSRLNLRTAWPVVVAPSRPRVRYPEVPVRIDVDPVRPGEHPGTEAPDELPLLGEEEDGIHVRADAGIGAAPLDHPDVAVGRDLHRARGSEASARRQLAPAHQGTEGVRGHGLCVHPPPPGDHDRRRRSQHPDPPKNTHGLFLLEVHDQGMARRPRGHALPEPRAVQVGGPRGVGLPGRGPGWRRLPEVGYAVRLQQREMAEILHLGVDLV